MELLQSRSQLLVQGDHSARHALAGFVSQVDRWSQVALCVCQHVPSERRYLFRPQPRFDGQQQDRVVARGVARLLDEGCCKGDLAFGQHLGLLGEPMANSCIIIPITE